MITQQEYPHYRLFKNNFVKTYLSKFPSEWQKTVEDIAAEKRISLYTFMCTEIGRTLIRGIQKHVKEDGPNIIGDLWRVYRDMLYEASAVFNFEAHGRKIIRPSVGLAKMLEATRCTLPLNLVKPPFPVVYFWLKGLGYYLYSGNDEQMISSQLEIEGVYVLIEDEIKELDENLTELTEKPGGLPPKAKTSKSGAIKKWSFCIVAPEIINGEKQYKFFHTSFAFFEDETCGLDDYISASLKCEIDEMTKRCGDAKIAQTMFDNTDRMSSLIFNTFLYMSSPEGKLDQRVEVPKILKQCAKEKNWFQKAKLTEEINRTCPAETTFIGQNISIPAGSEHAPVLSETDSDRSVRTHWRRGHYRHIWHGSFDSPDRHAVKQWIRPVLVNPKASPVPEQVFYRVREGKTP